MGCGCNSAVAAPRRARLDQVWPEGLDFPPWAPYLATLGTRARVADVLEDPAWTPLEEDPLDASMLAFLGDVLDGLAADLDDAAHPDSAAPEPPADACEPAYADLTDRINGLLANASIDLDTYGAGMDRYHDDPITKPEDCDWVFEGYAIRLLQPLGAASHYSGTWSSNLQYHVHTTSTCTVYLREYGLWRMYIPGPTLVSDADGSVPPTTGVVNPCGTGSGTEPNYSPDMFNTDRFSPAYLAFVDSPDVGMNFSVLAPEVANSGTGWEVTDDRLAGWTSTEIPTEPVRVGKPGPVPLGQKTTALMVKYQDITVLDMKEEIGYYLMIAVECRTQNIATASDFCTQSADGCGNGGTTMWTDLRTGSTFPYSHPYTRVVLFACTCADFRGVEIVGAPGNPDEAILLLAPDRGALGFPGKVCPNEWYGVPHAILTGDRSQILLYVPWTGYGDAVDDVPERVRTRYPADDTDYRSSRPDYYGTPLWEEGISGYSCFVIPVSDVEFLLSSLALPWVEQDTEAAAYLRDWFQAKVTRECYQGEVLITDGGSAGTRSTPAGAQNVPTSLRKGTDPHWVWINGELWVYWVQSSPGTGTSAELENDQLYRAKLTDKTTLSDFSYALDPNGDYTTFLAESTCWLTLDMRAVVGDPSAYPVDGRFFGRLLADPDVIQLDNGYLRVSFFGGVESDFVPTTGYAVAAAASGLLVAITSGAVATSVAEGGQV